MSNYIGRHSKRFCYYQPNSKDLMDKYGDCTIRALSKALGVTWLEAFDIETPFCRREQISGMFDCPLEIKKRIMDEIGFDYTGISNKKGSRRPTVDSFAKDHPTGTYICNVAHHEVAVVGGKYYDTWDSGNCSLYGFFTKREV